MIAIVVVVVALNWTWGRLPSEPKPTGAFIQVAGSKIHYLERPGSDPAVLLIHGLPGTANDFDAVTKLLPGRHTVAIDRPGFGYSSGGYLPYATQLTRIKGVIDKLQLHRPVVVGHSYGGALAIGLAHRYPNDVRSLVLVDAAGGGNDRTSLGTKLQTRFLQLVQVPVVQQVADLTFSQLVRTASADSGDKQAFSPNPVDPRHKQRLLASNMRHEDLDALAGERLAFNQVGPQITSWLPQIDTPATVIQGRSDKLVAPANGKAIAAGLPNAKLVLVSGGHMVPYTHPGVVAAAIKRAVRRP